jgi:hypothetical protein
MNRIPKYTAGMFKKKMPRFGAMAPKKPRLPTPPKPRVKKFEEGGDVEEEVIVSEDAVRRTNPELSAKIDRAKKARELAQSKDLVKRYLRERKVADEAEAKKKAEEGDMRRKFDEYMREREQRGLEEQGRFMQERKRGVRTARSGGKMSSCCRGDGIAKRGKTRGKFV